MDHSAPLMVGVSGLRGIVGESLTDDVAIRYAGAFGEWLKARCQSGGPLVVVGRDGRRGGQRVQATVVEGLHRAGCRVYDAGVAMTPTVGVAIDRGGLDGGMVVTASHNPQQWNGLKCLVRDPRDDAGRACAPGVAFAADIIDMWGRRAAPAQSGAPEVRPDGTATGDHVAKVAALLRDRHGLPEGLSVVVDSVNASGSMGAFSLLEAVRCRHLHPYGDRSGVFPHPPEPTAENLSGAGGLRDAVVEAGADVGFAQDPDGDRLAIIDEKGVYIGEEYTFVLCAIALLESRKEAAEATGEPVLVANLSTSRMIDDVAARYGARVVRTPVGEANVVEAMRREIKAGQDVVLGGEGNGGVIWPEVVFVRDSLSAMALTLALMARTGETISDLVARVPAYTIEKRKAPLSRKEDARPAIEAISAHWRGARQDTQDGIRLDFDDKSAWLHVRASNTEPIMRLIAEAPDREAARGMVDEAAGVIGAV